MVKVVLNSGIKVSGELIPSPYSGTDHMDRESHICVKQFMPHIILIKGKGESHRSLERVREDFKVALIYQRTIREVVNI